MKTSLIVNLISALCILSTCTTSVFAQITLPIEVTDSHLICRKANNLSYNITAPVPEAAFLANRIQRKYSLQKCKVKTKKVEFCVPATKRLYNANQIPYPYRPLSLVKAQELKNDFMCYIMTCKVRDDDVVFQKVADQFGLKKLKFSKAQKYRVCVPAWKLDDNGRPIVIR